jgi:hypothetical protein
MTPPAVPPVPPPPAKIPIVPAVSEDQIVDAVEELMPTIGGSSADDSTSTALGSLIAGLFINISRIAKGRSP